MMEGMGQGEMTYDCKNKFYQIDQKNTKARKEKSFIFTPTTYPGLSHQSSYSYTSEDGWIYDIMQEDTYVH